MSESNDIPTSPNALPFSGFPEIPITPNNWDLVPFGGRFPVLVDGFSYITAERCGLQYLAYYTQRRTCAVIPSNRRRGWSEPLLLDEIDGRKGYSPNLDVLWDARERGRAHPFTIDGALAEWKDALWGSTADFVLFGLPDTWVDDVEGLLHRMHEEGLFDDRMWLMTFGDVHPGTYIQPDLPLVYIAKTGAMFIPRLISERWERATVEQGLEDNGYA